MKRRRNHFDVTDTVRISHVADVRQACASLLQRVYPNADLRPLNQAFDMFARLYAGTLPGYVGCDTWYHDAQHSLDCALATVRLLHGHESSVAESERLGARRGVLGAVIALFHDAGYIRRTEDAARNGAEYTLTHVHRSGEFLASFLPMVGFSAEVPLTRQLVHFTGFEVALDRIQVSDPKDRLLGFMIGTADVLAQTADRCYLEKCRDYLYREFEICGLAGAPRNGHQKPLYADPEALLDGTPDFTRKLWAERMDGYFRGVHRYMDVHFGGANPYMEQIVEHINHLSKPRPGGRRGRPLNRRPRVIDAAQIREQLGIKPAETCRKSTPPLCAAA
jgi:hypothetical protein